MLGVMENIAPLVIGVMDTILQLILVRSARQELFLMVQNLVNPVLREVIQILMEPMNVHHALKDNISLKRGKPVVVYVELQNGQIQIKQVVTLVQKVMNAMLMVLKNNATPGIFLKEV